MLFVPSNNSHITSSSKLLEFSYYILTNTLRLLQDGLDKADMVQYKMSHKKKVQSPSEHLLLKAGTWQ